VSRREVYLLAMPLDAAEFLLKGSSSRSEPLRRLSVGWATLIKFRMVSPRGSTIIICVRGTTALILW
jgi:hypothetical protein